MSSFKDFLLSNRKEKQIRLFFDIETLQYNEEAGKETPSEFKNVVYSVAIGYYTKKLNIKVYPSFKKFFDEILETYKKWKTLPRIELIAHNTNKYDNHFLRHDLIYFYDLPVKNLYLKNANNESNAISIKKSKLTENDKKGVILEKRIKSSNNLELNFYINYIEFFTTDNYVKTNTSLKTLGEKLLKLNLVTEDDLKTDFDYKEFNKPYDMTDEQAYSYAEKVFYTKLTDEHMKYIHNDIVLLGESVINYGKLFKGFDYSSITFTSNILKYYNDDDLTSYQLLHSVGSGKDKKHLRYTDYVFGGENFYNYLKSFYRGGMNFYNDERVGKIINNRVIGMDINSSYPYAMHNFDIPTFLKEYHEFKEDTFIKLNKASNDFYLFRMNKHAFDSYLLEKITSKILRKMLVKYYTTNDYVNINSFTIKIIEDITKQKINELPVLSYVSFESIYFSSRDKIEEKYKVKTIGSSSKKIIYNSPYNIEELETENDDILTDEEIDISKVILNGLYGIPALRSHFNIFRWVGDELINFSNGYENNERNIVFSVFVTAVSLYNLLHPMSFLTEYEIDKHFIYCDTDSLYFDKLVLNKFPSNIFHDYHLGKWTLEYDNIEKFIVLNHKKYAYYVYDEKKQKKVIKIRCGGVPKNSFKTNMTFEQFVESQFSHGVKIKNTKSIYNKQGTISIYDSYTELQIGSGYRMFSHNERIDKMKKKMFDEILKSIENDYIDDFLYIESNLGTFSFNDLMPYEYEKEGKLPLSYLKQFEKFIRDEHFANIGK